MKTAVLRGCVSNNYSEIDGLEFNITTLSELIDILKKHSEIHLNYFEGEKDLDLWITRGD
jgi:hypothetical protein